MPPYKIETNKLNEIKIISGLFLHKDGLQSNQYKKFRKKEKNFGPVSLTQGSLDGACGPYALMMAILSLGISYEDIEELWGIQQDGRTKFGREMANYQGLINSGTYAEQLVTIYKSIADSKHADFQKFKALKDYEPEIIPLKNNDVIHHVVNHIKNTGLPAILGLSWSKTDGHWVTAIGYQSFRSSPDDSDLNEQLESLLVLDPGERINRTEMWNAVLATESKGKKFEYWTNSAQATDCTPDSCIIFNRK